MYELLQLHTVLLVIIRNRTRTLLSRRSKFVAVAGLLCAVILHGNISSAFQPPYAQKHTGCYLGCDVSQAWTRIAYPSRVDRCSLLGTQSNDEGKRLPDDLIHALDLAPLLDKVACHCGTYRGRHALLRLAGRPDTKKYSAARGPNVQQASSKRRRLVGATRYQLDEEKSNFSRNQRLAKQLAICPIATTANEVMEAYQRVAQATDCIKDEEQRTPPRDNDDDESRAFVPPLYPADSYGPLDTTTAIHTDDDEWLNFTVHDERWTLEHILQAEQVIIKLLKVHAWSERASFAPDLQKLATAHHHTHADRLRAVLAEIRDAVEIVRVRTLTDPNSRSSYQFRLRESKFAILGLLRQRCDGIAERVRGAAGQSQQQRLERELAMVKEEMAAKERDIRSGLIQTIHSARETIDDALNVVAQLDVIFAKAAFGCVTGGRSKIVSGQYGGITHVKGFVHPLLQLKTAPAVPIDLVLGNESQALIISGNNGGGKTLAMKSFGLVSVMAKLAIPVISSSIPIVDFVDEILVSVGDYQDVEGGESTFTAQLHRYSSLIGIVGSNCDKSYIVLLDELGAGTEEVAGGAIGQAVLEKLVASRSCRVVATTHSPLLKTLSFNGDKVRCAAVLLESEKRDENDSGEEYQRPSYRLQYNCIGESYAFGAASRCLPSDVVMRASSLMNSKESDHNLTSHASYMRALKESLEFQVDAANRAAALAKTSAHDSALIRREMLSLATAYDDHLLMLEQSVEQCYQTLKQQNNNNTSVHVLGESLAQLRIAQRQVKTERELLHERGLKRLPDLYKLATSEVVVIVDENSPWHGSSGAVASADSLPVDNGLTLAENDIVVVCSCSAWDDFTPPGVHLQDFAVPDEAIVFKRYQLAIWDYESVWEGDKSFNDIDLVKSIPDSRRKLSRLLSKLKTVGTSMDGGGAPKRAAQSFASSRERKAAKRKGKVKR